MTVTSNNFYEPGSAQKINDQGGIKVPQRFYSNRRVEQSNQSQLVTGHSTKMGVGNN